MIRAPYKDKVVSDVFTHRGDEFTAIGERSVAIRAGVDPGASRMVQKLSTHLCLV